jgi:hypothetical protein
MPASYPRLVHADIETHLTCSSETLHKATGATAITEEFYIRPIRT